MSVADPRRPGGPSRAPLIGAVLIAIGALLLLYLVLDDSGGPLDREQLISAGDEICAENNERLAELEDSEEGVPLDDTERAAEAVGRLNAPGVDTTRRLAELEPAPDVQEPFDELIRLRERRGRLQQTVIEALDVGDSDAAGDAQNASVRLYSGPIREVAEGIGFEVCGQPLPE